MMMRVKMDKKKKSINGCKALFEPSVSALVLVVVVVVVGVNSTTSSAKNEKRAFALHKYM
jgi:hypothetical protein